MILSINQLFSDAQAITADAISNVIDLGLARTPHRAKAALEQDIGKGSAVPLLIQVVEAFNTLTSLEITVEVSANADLSSSTVLLTQSIPLADLVAGKTTYVQVVPTGASKRYLGIRYNVVGTNPTEGKITAGITVGNQTNFTGA